MCGIVGVIGPGRQEVPLASCAVLAHRGPDDESIVGGDGFALGFRRLAILDLSPAGRQPMCSEDGWCWIAFNGEIYNYVELRTELEGKGESFRSRSDTEVLLKLLRREGPAGLSRLNGMFALAFVDIRNRKFLLARDRLGVKPLYLWRRGGTLRFASELKALLAFPGAASTLNPEAVAAHFAIGYLPGPVCAFRGYEKLAPAHYLEGSLDRPDSAEPRRWWSRPEPSAEAAAGRQVGEEDEELDALLADATRIRLRSDVPVGVFLSGGIDSGLVSSYAATAGSRLPFALTVGWQGEEAAETDETDLAETTARHVGLAHEVVQQGVAGLEAVDRISWFYDEPFADSSQLPTFALCEAARRKGIVFLGGDGGDEAFAGYHRHLGAERWKWLRRFPPALRAVGRAAALGLPRFSRARYRLLKASLADDGFAAAFDSVPEDPVYKAIVHPDVRPYLRVAGGRFWQPWALSRGRGILERQRQLDYDLYLPDDILVKVDRASMANSIEVRSPFLDYRVVEWAARMEVARFVRDGVGKVPLRRLARKRLPASVSGGEKKGFGVPLESWLRQPRVISWLRGRLLSPEALRRRLWTERGVTGLLDRLGRKGGRDLSNVAWKLLTLDAWCRHYVDGAVKVLPPLFTP